MGKKKTKLKRAARLMARYAAKEYQIWFILTWCVFLLYVVFNELDKNLYP